MNSESFTLRDALELAITTERLGAVFYRRMADKFKTESEIADVFSKLADDERGHEAQFRELADQINIEKGTDPDNVQFNFLKVITVSELFGRDYFDDLATYKSYSDVLVKAAEFEKATLLFYLELKEIIGENPQLDAIIKSEKKHVIALLTPILTDAKFRGMNDNW